MNVIFKYKHTTPNRNCRSLLVHLIKIRLFLPLGLGCFLIALTSSCAQDDVPQKDNRLIAKVFNKSLFQSEIDELIGVGTAPRDSTQIANAYIEKWIREAVLMHEAEKYVPKDLNIDELVRDYRASLIRHNYEKLLVENTMDSTINETELISYYEENKEQFKLKSPIIKCRFIKAPKPAEDWKNVEKWWKKNDEESYKMLLDYCSRNEVAYMLNDSTWYDLDNISLYFPKGKLTASNYKSNRNINTDDENFEYLLKIFDSTPAGEYAPLAFVEEQAVKVILHKRKINLLEEKKEEMYERETNNIKVYVE